MKKMMLTGLMFFSLSFANAIEIRPQFRVWKSTYLDSSTGDIMLSSAPIIFHGIVLSSPTVNQSNSYFVVVQTTGDVMQPIVSTKAYIYTDSSALNQVVTFPYDILVTSHAFISKQGAAKITVLWDWLIKPPYTTNQDNQ